MSVRLRRFGWWVVALGALATAPPLAGQDESSPVVDYVVAVVGNRPILNSMVEERIFARQSAGQTVPPAGDALKALRLEVISELIDEELLVQKAERDTTITVTDQEVASGVEQQYRNVRQRFTTEPEFRRELQKSGFQTPEEFRRWLAESQRREALQTKVIEKLRANGDLKPVPPTEAQLRDYFEQTKSSLGTRPATISFRQIVIAPQADSAAKVVAYARADSIARALRAGADFATAARRFSQDPGSREQGGSLNWLRRGPPLDPAFEQAAFGLKPGVISNPVESSFGFHIIQVERVQPTEVQVRHILIMPEITPANAERARSLADSLLRTLRRGASFDSLQRLYHDRGEEQEAPEVPVTQLPKPYQDALAGLDSGAVSNVFTLETGENRSKYVIAQVTKRHPEGAVTFADVRDRIRTVVAGNLATRRYLDRLRAGQYVEIRSP